ncbi:AI-2E family transporter [bacterium]|nr:AI-2E family transporter [bacterium]
MKFSSIQSTVFFGLLVAITVVFFWLIRDFLLPVFWAVVFAIIFRPVHEWWLRETRGKGSLAATATLITIVIIVIAPIAFVGSLLAKESVGLYDHITTTTANEGGADGIMQNISFLTDRLERFGIDDNKLKQKLGAFAQTASAWLASKALTVGQNVFGFLLQFFVMLYLLFFMLRDGESMEKKIIKILPLGDAREKRLLSKFTSTTRATVKGVFAVAVLQGGIGGILFFLAGINAPVLWGVVMGVFSVVPAVGPALVWLPAGIFLVATGALWQGILVLAGGALIISVIDNIMRPYLVGKDIEMPDELVLLSTLGGLSLFGMTGFVAGPVIAGFFLSVWAMFEEEYKEDLEIRG